MCRWSFVVVLAAHLALVESSCSPTKKYYVDCSTARSLHDAVRTCNQYGMTLLNLTNSVNLTSDIAELNSTIVAVSCMEKFWFSSGNTTGYVASVGTLTTVLTSLLNGVTLVVGAILDILGCLLGICPITTTLPPITVAMTVCVRPMQQRVIQKCLVTPVQSDMKIFQFQEAPLYGGVLNSFPLNSRTACSGLCASDDECVGISYINEICTLYV